MSRNRRPYVAIDAFLDSRPAIITVGPWASIVWQYLLRTSKRLRLDGHLPQGQREPAVVRAGLGFPAGATYDGTPLEEVIKAATYALDRFSIACRCSPGCRLVRDWSEWQIDPTHADRQRRYRDRSDDRSDAKVTAENVTRDGTTPTPTPTPTPTRIGKDKDMGATPPLADRVGDVFAYWQKVTDHGKAKLTPDRAAKIRARLREGYDVATLCKAIDGCKASKFHNGENDSGAVYDSLGLIFRTAGKVDEFVARVPVPKCGFCGRRSATRTAGRDHPACDACGAHADEYGVEENWRPVCE